MHFCWCVHEKQFCIILYESAIVIFERKHTFLYFFEQIDKIFNKDFKPSWDDYLRLRVRTSGFMSQTFTKTFKNSNFPHKFQIIDVGGQRSERNKWFSLIDDTIGRVLYVVSIGDYDKVTYEDARTKRLEEALSLFQKVIEQGFFKNKEIIVFLNKIDLFKEKLSTVFYSY